MLLRVGQVISGCLVRVVYVWLAGVGTGLTQSGIGLGSLRSCWLYGCGSVVGGDEVLCKEYKEVKGLGVLWV